MLVWPQVTALGAHALIRHCIAPLCVGEDGPGALALKEGILGPFTGFTLSTMITQLCILHRIMFIILPT
jgi:hypothetical protein